MKLCGWYDASPCLILVSQIDARGLVRCVLYRLRFPTIVTALRSEEPTEPDVITETMIFGCNEPLIPGFPLYVSGLIPVVYYMHKRSSVYLLPCSTLISFHDDK